MCVEEEEEEEVGPDTGDVCAGKNGFIAFFGVARVN